MDPNQKKPLSPEEQAALLRKPEGEGADDIFAYMNRGNAVLYPQILQTCSKMEAQAILELGPGNGVLIQDLLHAFPTATYTGIDYSEDCIAACKKLNSTVAPSRMHLELGTMASMPFANNTFDLVLGVNVIYFWDHAAATLVEISRVMKQGATLVLGYRPAHKLGQLEFTKFGFTLYEASQLESILQQAGFTNIRSRSYKEADRFTDKGILEMECLITTAVKA